MKLFIGNWKILGNDSDILSYPEQKRDIAQLLQYLDKKIGVKQIKYIQLVMMY